MYIEIFMFKSDSLLPLTKINASIKAIKNAFKENEELVNFIPALVLLIQI